MIATAMPVVKPLVTGHGMNLMSEPIFVSPMMTRITPAMTVAINRPL